MPRWGAIGLLCVGCNALLGIDSDVELLCDRGEQCPSGFCGADNTCDAQQWARSFGGPGRDIATDLVHVDADGDGSDPGWTVVVGSFTESLDLGNGTSLEGGGDRDTFVVALDHLGEIRWARAFGGPGDQLAEAVVAGPGGEIYVAGTFAGQAEHGDTRLESDPAVEDGFIASWSDEGEPRWARLFGGTERLTVVDMVVVEGDQPTPIGDSLGVWTSGPGEAGVDNGQQASYTVTFAADGSVGQPNVAFAMMGDLQSCCARVDPLTGDVVVGGDIREGDAVGSFLIFFRDGQAPESTVYQQPLSAFSTDSLARIVIGWTGALGLPAPGIGVARLEEQGGPVVRGEADTDDVELRALVHDSTNAIVGFGRFRNRLRFIEGETFEADDWDLFVLSVAEDFSLPAGHSRAFGGDGDVTPGAVALDAHDRMIITGSFDGELELDNAQGSRRLEAVDDEDVFVAQIQR